MNIFFPFVLRSISILLFCAPVFVLAQQASGNKVSSNVTHVVVISIDGLRPEFYLDPSWPAPNLRKMATEGVAAEGVRGVFPSVTYPSHTTIVTGAMPAKHGIYYNSPFEPSGSTGRWYWETALIKTPTLWHAVQQSGKTSASVAWPVTVGAPINWNLPEVWEVNRSIDRTTAIRREATPAGLFEEIEQFATGKLSGEDLNSDYFSMDENTGRMAAYLVKKYKPNFTTVHLVCADHAQHGEGREGMHVRQAVATADRAIGNILEAIQRAGISENTAVVVVGDHGFSNIHSVMSPNTLLLKAGMGKEGDKPGQFKAWFHTSGAAAFLHLQNKADLKTAQQIRQLLQNLPAAQKKLFRIVERRELDSIGADPNAIFALAPIEGVSMNASEKGDLIKPAKGGTHGFFPDFQRIHTGFVGYGKGFSSHRLVPLMGLEDIAPIIAKLLNLPFEAPDGQLLPGILEQP